MDRSELRRKALVSAASVVFAMALPACQSDGKGEDRDGRSGQDSAGQSTDSGTTGGDGATGGGGDGASDGGTGGAADSGSSTGGGGGDTASGGAKPDCVALGLDVTACCEALAAWCSEAVSAGTPEYDECVYGPGYDGSTGCIPWGPPVPPAADLAALA